MGGAENCSWDVMFERIKKKNLPYVFLCFRTGALYLWVVTHLGVK